MSGSKIGFNFQTVNKFEQAQEQKTPTKTASHQTASQTNDYIVKRGDTLTEIAVKTGQNLQQLLQRNQQIKNPNKIQIGQHINISKPSNLYTVKSGDTLSEIARAKHTTIGGLMRANPGEIGNRNLIYPGQKLNIPASISQTSPEARKPTPPSKTKPPVSSKPIETSSTKIENKPKAEQPKTISNVNISQSQSVSSTGWNTAKVSTGDFFNRKQGFTVLAAVIIGQAEGNINEFGKPTKNYFGHKDPGDGKWNLGAFSYAPRGPNAPVAHSPQEADQIHLRALKGGVEKYTNALQRAGLDPENVWLQSTYFDVLNQAGSQIADKMLESKSLEYIKKNGVSPETMKEWRMQAYINIDSGKRWVRTSGKMKGIPFGSAFKTDEKLSRDQDRRGKAIQTILKNLNLIQKSETRIQPTGDAGKSAPVTEQNLPQTKFSESNKTELTGAEIKIPHAELKAGNNIRLSPALIGKMKNIAVEYKQATGNNLTITDGNRTPLEQSYMMIRQIRKGKLGIYRRKDAAAEVGKTYDNARAQGKSDKEIAQTISLVIEGQMKKGIYISPHLTNKGTDVRFWDMSNANKAKFVEIVNKYGGEVVKENDHFHLQFKQ